MIGVEGTSAPAGLHILDGATDRLSPEQAELIGEFWRLLERFPVPTNDWHFHVPLIRACRDQFAQDIGRAAGRPATVAVLSALIDGTVAAEFDRGASGELTAAWDRLADLP